MTTTTYAVTGMTCAHCVSAVTEEIAKLAGVVGIEVDLVAGGESRVTVTSQAAVPETDMRAAVDEAGYVLTGGS
ncbi:MAG: heavy-metal-associated domain-containing protein [Jiangellaceae bacterium]